MNDLAFPRGHTFIFHTDLITGCDICEVEAKCVRFCNDGKMVRKMDICAPCIKENAVPDGYTVECWCTECEATIPDALRPECIAV